MTDTHSSKPPLLSMHLRAAAVAGTRTQLCSVSLHNLAQCTCTSQRAEGEVAQHNTFTSTHITEFLL